MLLAAGDGTLTGSKYLWLYSQENVPPTRRKEFDALRRKALKVGRAWALKEAFRHLWAYVYPASGWKFWKRWYFWATHSRLAPMRKAAQTVRRHIDNILTYYQHPVTNAMSEGLNSKIQKSRTWPAVSVTSRTSRRLSIFTVAGWIFTHANVGSPISISLQSSAFILQSLAFSLQPSAFGLSTSVVSNSLFFLGL